MRCGSGSALDAGIVPGQADPPVMICNVDLSDWTGSRAKRDCLYNVVAISGTPHRMGMPRRFEHDGGPARFGRHPSPAPAIRTDARPFPPNASPGHPGSTPAHATSPRPVAFVSFARWRMFFHRIVVMSSSIPASPHSHQIHRHAWRRQAKRLLAIAATLIAVGAVAQVVAPPEGKRSDGANRVEAAPGGASRR